MARDDGIRKVHQALDALRFGEQHILNLRESLPTAAQAAARAEQWLRQKQAESVDRVLVITGRGNNSPGGVSPVREAFVRLLSSLRRRGVVERYEEHTPGSFAVELAPFSTAVQPGQDRSDAAADPVPDIPGIEPEVRQMLRNLAERSLEALGIKDTGAFLEREMQRQYSAIVISLGTGPNRERRLRAAIRSALDRLP
jgi:hypothetical protein